MAEVGWLPGLGWAGLGWAAWAGWVGLAGWLACWLAGCWLAGLLARWTLNRDLEGQGHKVIKLRLLVLILSISGAKARKLSHRDFWA